LTPREAVAAIRAAAWRRAEAERQAVTTAWLVASFGRQKRLPSLDRLVPRAGEKKRAKTPEEQLAFVRAFAKAHNKRMDGV